MVVMGVVCVGDVSGSLRFLGVVADDVRDLRGRGWDSPAESFIERLGTESAGECFVGFVVRGAIMCLVKRIGGQDAKRGWVVMPTKLAERIFARRSLNMRWVADLQNRIQIPALFGNRMLIRKISGFSYYLDWRHLLVYLAHFEVISLLLQSRRTKLTPAKICRIHRFESVAFCSTRESV